MEPSEPTEVSYYQATKPPLLSDYSRRSPAQMSHDLNIAHDFIRKLVTEKDHINGRLGNALLRLQSQKLWIKMLTASVVASWAVIGWIVKEFLSRWGH